MEVTGITDKVFSIGKKLAPLAGIWQGFMTEPLSDGRTFNDIPTYLYNRLFIMDKSIGKGHIPNPLTTTMLAITQPERFPIFSGATMAITGWLAEIIGRSVDAGQIGSVVTNFGTIMKKYGTAAAISGLIAGWLYLAPYNPAGIGTHGSGTSMNPSMGATGSTSPMWSGAPGGPNFPHASATNGYKATLGGFEGVVA